MCQGESALHPGGRQEWAARPGAPFPPHQRGAATHARAVAPPTALSCARRKWCYRTSWGLASLSYGCCRAVGLTGATIMQPAEWRIGETTEIGYVCLVCACCSMGT